MTSSTRPIGATGEVTTEKEIVAADGHHATPITNGQYVPNIHGQPDNPARGSNGEALPYTEIDNNPLPQLVFGDAMPEVVKPSAAVYPDAVREDFVSGPIPVENRGEEENRNSSAGGPWYKRKSATVLATIGLVAVVGILAVLFGTLGGLGVFDNNRSSSASTAPDPTQNLSSSSSLGAAAPTGSTASSSPTTSPLTTSSSSTVSTTPPLLHMLALTFPPPVGLPLSDSSAGMHRLLNLYPKHILRHR